MGYDHRHPGVDRPHQLVPRGRQDAERRKRPAPAGGFRRKKSLGSPRAGGYHRATRTAASTGAVAISPAPSSDKSSDPAVTPSAAPDTASPQSATDRPGGTTGRLRLEPGVEPAPGFTLVRFLGRGGFGEVWKATGPGGFPDGQDSTDVELTAADSAVVGACQGTLTARAGDVRADGPLEVTVIALGNEFTNALGMKLKRIKAGTFTMGSPDTEDGRFDSEGPQHKVTITQPFYLGVCPVTQREYEQVIGKNPSCFSKDGGGKDKVQGLDTRRFSVETVSWDEAVALCEALNKQDKNKPAEWGYGLQTEAEWEYACRAGTTTAYSFGDDPKQLGDYAWFWDNAEQRAHEVGTRKPNPWGLYDMHGGVWQWCADHYGQYESGDFKDPKGPDSGEGRVLRGGSWYNGPRNCRSAYRVVNDPGYRHFFIGFRVVLRPPARTP
jgi:formylglycine-generating enzyme required for sulfatase activity